MFSLNHSLRTSNSVRLYTVSNACNSYSYNFPFKSKSITWFVIIITTLWMTILFIALAYYHNILDWSKFWSIDQRVSKIIMNFPRRPQIASFHFSWRSLLNVVLTSSIMKRYILPTIFGKLNSFKAWWNLNSTLLCKWSNLLFTIFFC